MAAKHYTPGSLGPLIHCSYLSFMVCSQALEGRFMLNGAEVPLPVRSHDSLAHKVEALRMYLEQKLGTDPFLK
jgi:hypothetical protein